MRGDWLDSLKVGDPVAVCHGYAGDYLAKVDRLTATQIVVGSYRYRRQSGHALGGGRWDTNFLYEPTPTVVDALQRKILIKRLGTVKWADLSDEVLRAVVQLVDFGPST